MKVIRAILNDPENVGDIIQQDVESDDMYQREYLHPQMLGNAEAQIKAMASNINESIDSLKKLLVENKFDASTEYEIGKCIKLLSFEL